MPRINVIKPFPFVPIDEVHPHMVEAGEQEVSERCAEVALEEGWAIPLEGKAAGPGLPFPDSGPEKPSPSPRPARRSRKSSSSKSEAAPA